MNWVLIANTGNYPATNYVNSAMILVTLSIAIVGLVGIIRGTRKEEAEKKIVGRVSPGYIDIYERTKEYFKAPGVFRLLKRQWNYLYPKKEADGQ